VPFQLWIVAAVLAAASPSFAKEAAPKGAVHSWSEKSEPVVVPVGEPELVPRSAFESDFPMIDTPAAPVATKPPAVAPSPVAEKPADVAAVPSKALGAANAPETVRPAPKEIYVATPSDEIAAIAPAPAVVESPVAVEVGEGPYGRPASPVLPPSDYVPPGARVPAAPAVVEAPAADGEPAADGAPAVVEDPPADEPATAAVVPPPAPRAEPKREAAPAVVRSRVPSGAAEKAAARAYLAAMQARPDPYEVTATRRGFQGDVASASSPATPGSGVLPPKIIDVPSPHSHSSHSSHDTPYGVPARRTADREMLMREFPDDLVERMWLQDWTDIERATQFGQLVDVPSDPDGRGIVLRLEGGSRIGELTTDDYQQALLCRLTKPAVGLLYRIASRMRQIEGPDYVPLEITSLVRTWDYQLRLSDVNPNADRTRDGVPPTHVLGMAFDIARTQMSYERQQRLEDVFDELGATGEMAYYKEGSHNGLMHYHVMALPSAETQLARYYERDSHFREQAVVTYGERAKLPEAPCVTFGSSLEPFSAICSCELPLEVSAVATTTPEAPGAVSAPISR
jgi:hypothetical protein